MSLLQLMTKKKTKRLFPSLDSTRSFLPPTELLKQRKRGKGFLLVGTEKDPRKKSGKEKLVAHSSTPFRK